MGTAAIQCCSPTLPLQEMDLNPLAFMFGEDNNETKIIHEDSISCRNKDIESVMKDCEGKLKESAKLFKDPLMKSQPVILRSYSSQDHEVKCTYERPYIFLNDPTTGRGKKYKIVDTTDCKSSQIIVRDEVLQYFGVFLCFLSQNPNLIYEAILTDSNTYGICVLQMYLGTKKEFVFIDDYILCCEKKPLFTQPIKGMYMWPCLLEKAWFKVKGNLTKKIEKNSPEEVFQAFFSHPIKRYIFHPTDSILNRTILRKNLFKLEPNKGYFVTSKREPSHKIGISGRKFYYLLKTIEQQGKILYYLRNPCGLFDFRGSYRLISEQLENKLRKETGEHKIADGNFLLDQQEFLQQIEEFSIIHYSKSSQIISQEQLEVDINQELMIQTELKSDGLVSVSFIQTGLKYPEQSYVPLTYQVIALKDNTLVSGKVNEDACFGMRISHLLDEPLIKLQAGQYLIRIKKKIGSVKKYQVKDYQSKKDKIVISAPFAVKFDYKRTQIFEQNFKQFLREEGKRQLKKSAIKKSKEDIDHCIFWLGDLAIVYVEKHNNFKEDIRVQVHFPQLKNIECIWPITPKIGKDYQALPAFKQNLLIIFQKINLAEETTIGKYVIESF